MKIFVVGFVTVVLYTLLGQYNAKQAEDADNEIEDKLPETLNAPEGMKKKYLSYLSGYDKEGRPIWISEFGKWDLKNIVDGGILKIMEFDTYFDNLLLRKNKSPNKTETTKANKKPLGWVSILDFDEYSSQQLTSLTTVTYATKIAQTFVLGAKNMDYAYFINVNPVAETFFKQLGPILEPMLGRAEIYGTNKAKWQPAILKRIPKNSLPEKYGGYANFTPVEM